MSNESYRPTYRPGDLVKAHFHDDVLLVERTSGTSPDNAVCQVKHRGGTYDVLESALRPLTFREFCWYKDPIHGRYRIGRMGWVESIVIVLATLIVGYNAFSVEELGWKFVTLGLACTMAAFVACGVWANYHRMYLPWK